MMIAPTRLFGAAATFVAAMSCAEIAAVRADDAAQRYAVAAGHFQRQRWELAAEEFQALLAEHPRSAWAAQARFYLGESLLRNGRPAEAAAAFREYLQDSPDPDLAPAARFRVGEADYLAGRYDAARQAFLRLADDGPPPTLAARTWFYLGDLAARQADWSASLDAFATVTAAYPDCELFDQAVLGQARAYLQRGEPAAAWTALRSLGTGDDSPWATEIAWLGGQSLERLGCADDATAAYDRFLAISKNDPRAFDALAATARMAARAGRHADAVERFARADAIGRNDPRRDALLYDWAWTLADMGKPAAAAEQFARLCTERPTSALRPDAEYRLAERALAEGRHDEAKRRVAAASDAADDLLPHVLLLDGQIETARGRFDDADRAFDALLKKFPEHETARVAAFCRAEAAWQAGDWRRAADRFAELTGRAELSDEPWFASAWLRLAQARTQLGEWSEVVRLAEQAKRRLPQFERRYEFDLSAGRAHAARAEFREAREAYERVLADDRAKQTEAAALAQFLIGESYFHQRNFEAALRAYLRVEILHRASEWPSAALLQAGKCYEQLGRHVDARRTYEQLLAEHAASPYAADAHRRLTAVAAAAQSGSQTKRQ